jgi:hypothetical protein
MQRALDGSVRTHELYAYSSGASAKREPLAEIHTSASELSMK